MSGHLPETTPFASPARRRRFAWGLLLLGIVIGWVLLSFSPTWQRRE
jgi:hypothetical protein